MQAEELDQIRQNDILISSMGNPVTNPHIVESGIRILNINEQGFQCQRIHPFHNGETYFLRRDAMEKSYWIRIPIGIQPSMF
jgi:hypothetical protein